MGSRRFGFGFDFGFGAEVDDDDEEVEGSSELGLDDEEAEEDEEDEETLKKPGVVVTDLMQNPAEGVSLTWTLSVGGAIFLSSYCRAYYSLVLLPFLLVSFGFLSF